MSAVHYAGLMITTLPEQASTLEKLQKGDITGFVEEVRPCLAFGSPTSAARLHASHLNFLLHTATGMSCLHMPQAVGRLCLLFPVGE